MKIQKTPIKNFGLIPSLFFSMALCLPSSLLMAVTVPQSIINQQLDSAELVADVAVESVSVVSDSNFYAKSLIHANLLQIHRSKFKETLQTLNTIEIDVPGGELGNQGVIFSGLPRPRAGHSYRAYLNRVDSLSGNHFQITGLEWGLTPLTPQRQYSRNRTDGSNGDGTGPFLFWAPNYLPISFYISSPSFKNLPEFVTEIEKSFKTWRAYDDVLVEFIAMGCNRSTNNENDGLNTVILMKDQWPFDSSAIAITRNFYIAGDDANAGMILDSDILLNGANYAFTATGEAGKHDIQNIVTHEIGHLLGFGHEITPADNQATMFASANPGETNKKNLHANDIAVLREAYSGVGLKLQNQDLHCDVVSSNVGCLSVHSEQKRYGSYLGLIAYLILTWFLGKLIQRKTKVT